MTPILILQAVVSFLVTVAICIFFSFKGANLAYEFTKERGYKFRGKFALVFLNNVLWQVLAFFLNRALIDLIIAQM